MPVTQLGTRKTKTKKREEDPVFKVFIFYSETILKNSLGHKHETGVKHVQVQGS